MDLNLIKEIFSVYSGINYVYRCVNLAKKKPEFSIDFYKLALNECLKCGFLDLHKTISKELPSTIKGYEFSKGI